MIHIKSFVYENDNKIETKVLQFDSKHEKNLEILSEMIREKLEKRLKVSLDEFVTLCSHYLVKEFRLKRIPLKIQQGFSRMLSVNKVSIRSFEKVEKITWKYR